MKTFSKVLSLLIAVMMCLTMVSTAAYALELDIDSAGSIDLGSGASYDGGMSLDMGSDAAYDGGFSLDGSAGQTASSWDDGSISLDAGTQDQSGISLDGGSEEQMVLVTEPEQDQFTLNDAPVFNSAAGVIATVGTTGCKSVDEINKAIANGGTLTLVANVDGTIIINKATTIELNDKTLSGVIMVYGALSIRGDGTVSSTLDKKDGGSITLYGGTYSDANFTKYIASGYTKDGSKVVAKSAASTGAIALVNGKDCFSLSDLNDMLGSGSASVILNQAVTGDIIFRYGGSLDLNGYTLTGSVITYGALNISDSAETGSITGSVTAMGSVKVSITGGGFATAPNANYIANGYMYNGTRVVPIESQAVARIGTRYYTTLDAAIQAAGSGETIVCIERTDLASANYSITNPITKNLTIQLGSNGINTVVVDNASVNFTGGYIGTLTSQNNAVVRLSGTQVTTMNENGGTIVSSGSGSSGGSGSGSYSYGSATVYNSPYLKYYGDPVYLQPVASGAYEGFAYFKSGSSKGGTALSAGAYRFSYDQRMILDESFLNGLTDGDYDLYGYVTSTSGSRTFTLLGTFVVYTDSPTPATSWWLTPDYSIWYTGEDPLVFESNMFDKNLIGTKILPILRYGTSGTPTKSITYEQFWEFDGNGYFMLGKNFLNSLSANQTYYLQVVDANNPNVNYTNIVRFRLGPTLKAIDTDKHVIGSTKNLRFLASEPVAAVYVGNIQLTSDSDYALWNGGQTVVLSSEFLNQRTAGNTYTLKVLTYNGETASTTFQILTTSQASASPRTGDTSNIGLWAAFLMLSGTAIVVLVPKLRKHGM